MTHAMGSKRGSRQPMSGKDIILLVDGKVMDPEEYSVSMEYTDGGQATSSRRAHVSTMGDQYRRSSVNTHRDS